MQIRNMSHFSRTFIVIATGMFLLLFNSAHSQLVVNPGSPQTVCKGDSVTLGGTPTASGGSPPYTYTWTSTPAAGINNVNDANPRALINQTTKFIVTVTDSAGRKIDSVTISVANIYAANAGHDTNICPLTAGATLGGSADSSSYNYIWTPVGSGLSCYTCPHPSATPTATTTYTLIASSTGGCADTTSVTVNVLASPTLTVVSPVTVNQGSSTTLSVSGAVNYFWTPDTGIIYNPNSANPEVFPTSNTVFLVEGIGANGCPAFDTVLVEVIPDSNLVFYNTFTPNGDGINDTWFVGNLGLYPNNILTIYNRYGKQVFYEQPYLNDWRGTNLGQNLPDATYYYILETGSGKTYRGSVTIIRKPK